MWEAHLPLSHAHTPTQILQNALRVVRWRKQTSLQSSQCLVWPYFDLSQCISRQFLGGPDSWCFLGSVHTYPEIFVSANFFMRIHLASTRVRRIRLVYPEISVYALQSGNFCTRSVSGYVWTLVSVDFFIR